MIQVTKTFFPPKKEFNVWVDKIYENEWLTNRGALVKELEGKLKNFLNVCNLTLTTNGTLPIQIAIKAMEIQGEVITTPFSYVATTSSIVWEGCKPVFVDIHPEYLTIDESKIEEAITNKTTAILATHVFGNPCNVEEIERIALKYGLKVIYDAAHCFGVKYKGESIFNFGDVSTCSFHATKIFHTGEGGCWITKDTNLHEKLYFHHNFGHKDPEEFFGLGINAKMSELQAAMGLSVFNYIEDIFEGRKEVVDSYNGQLKDIGLQNIKIREGTEWNYHYYPLIFQSEAQLLKCKEALNEIDIFPRRYFFPSLNTLSYVSSKSMPISESVSVRVLCLPLYVGLERKEIDIIVKTIKSCI